MIKLLYTTPCPLILSHYPPKGFLSMDCLDSLQLPIFIEKLQFSCNLHHRQKTLENPKITINDKFTFHYLPAPNYSPADTNYDSAQSTSSTISNYPHSLRNCNQYFKISQQHPKKSEKIDWCPRPWWPWCCWGLFFRYMTMIMARQTPKNPKIHWENVTNISKTATTPKNPFKKSLMTPMVMSKLLLTMMLTKPLILLTTMLYPQTPKNPHIHRETSIMPLIPMLIMLPPPTLS